MERMTLSGTLFTIVTSFVREEMNQLTSKMSLKSLHRKQKQIQIMHDKSNMFNWQKLAKSYLSSFQ